MNDSDETVCGNESGGESTQNSPSILSKWDPEKTTIHSSEKSKNIPKTISVENEETSREPSSPEQGVSPEFPLYARGFKRKENFDGNNGTNLDRNHKTSNVEIDAELQTSSNDSNRLENLLKTLEELVKDLETKPGAACNLDGLFQHAKCQLADVQKLLVESNRYNQGERKKVLSSGDSEDTQQLSEEKKLLIVNLAEKQRNLLDAFKRYRNLVQRLKTVKDQSQSLERTQQPLVSKQSLTAPTNGSVFTSTLTGQKANNCAQMVTRASENASKSAPRIVLADAMNSGLTKAVKEGRVKFISLQNQSNNLPSSGSVGSSGDYSKQDGHLSRPVSTTETRIQTASQFQRSASGTASQNTAVTTITIADVSSTKANDVQSSSIKLSLPSTTKNPTCVPTSRFAKTQATAATRPQTQANHLLRSAMSTNFTSPAPKQTENVSNRFSKQIPESYLTLGTLLRHGVLAPGNNVLTVSSEGKQYFASLSDKGTIVSVGGEGFTSPRSWVKAILGSKRKLKKDLAWKMVSYKNKPLIDHASALTLYPSKSTGPSLDCYLENRDTQVSIENNITRNRTRQDLINTTLSLKALLSNCRVRQISKEEIIISDQIPKDFWDNDEAELSSDDISKAFDF